MSRKQNTLKGSRPERAAVRVARNIVNDIKVRSLGPGTPLEPEHIMVEKQGVARATVREALRFLELQGALRIKAGPRGGPVVSVPGVADLTSALSLQLQFADASFRSVIDARMAIYPVLAGQAAKHATHQDIRALHQCIDRLREAVKESDALAAEARQFQELVAVASKNLVLGFLLNALHRMSENAGIEYDFDQRQASVRQMAKILQAIEKSDSEAAQAVTERMLKAALRYWEKAAPDLLNEPVSWTTAD
jgi:DNA-binding FadR family transcriptional regulator